MANEKKEKKGKSGVIIIAAVAVFAVVLGLVLSISLGGSKEKPVIEQTLNLDEFIVNVKGSNNTYVKFGLAITYDGNNKKGVESLNGNLHKVRDGIISIFKDKTVDYIKDSQGLDVIKNEIKTKIDSIIGEGTVLSVYFTDLLVH